MPSRIFVQVASYRDPELVPTIKHCLLRAEFPENLSFGICCQDETFPTDYDANPQFQILKVPYQESKGACWARSKVNGMYKGEEFTLQIDSHMRFIPGWDRKLIRVWKELNDPKAVLTTYPAEYLPEQSEEEWKQEPHIIHTHAFVNHQTQQRPKTPLGWQTRTTPYKAIHVAAGFVFGPGSIVTDVPYDPEFYFAGEETALAVRLYTHGYNLFHPHRIALWHYYGRKEQPKHWSDDKNWGDLNKKAEDRLNCLLDRNKNYDLGRYGLGSVRTLADFQNYSGIDFKRSVLHLDTISAKEPPVNLSDPLLWSYDTKTFKKKMVWADADVDKCDDPRFWAFIFKDQNGHELFRKDVTFAEDEDLLEGRTTEKEFEFDYYSPAQVPSIFMIWPYSESKQWIKSKQWSIKP